MLLVWSRRLLRCSPAHQDLKSKLRKRMQLNANNPTGLDLEDAQDSLFAIDAQAIDERALKRLGVQEVPEEVTGQACYRLFQRALRPMLGCDAPFVLRPIETGCQVYELGRGL